MKHDVLLRRLYLWKVPLRAAFYTKSATRVLRVAIKCAAYFVDYLNFATEILDSSLILTYFHSAHLHLSDHWDSVCCVESVTFFVFYYSRVPSSFFSLPPSIRVSLR